MLSASTATRRRGPGCTNCGVRWFVPIGTASSAWSRSTRCTSEARRRAFRGATRRRRPSWPSPWRSSTRRKLGRVRLRRVADVSGDALQPFVQEAVEPGSSVLTDAWGGYDHRVMNQSASPDPAHVLMPAVDRVAVLLKGWLLGTYQGAVSRKHLNYYFDEYTFRFNRRGSRSRGVSSAGAGCSDATYANSRALHGHRERTPLMGSHHYMLCQVA